MAEPAANKPSAILSTGTLEANYFSPVDEVRKGAVSAVTLYEKHVYLGWGSGHVDRVNIEEGGRHLAPSSVGFPIMAMAASAHHVALGTDRGALYVLDDKFESHSTWTIHKAVSMARLHFCTADLLVGGFADGQMGCWSLSNKRRLWTAQAHVEGIMSFCHSPAGLWAGSLDGAISQWDVKNGKILRYLASNVQVYRLLNWDEKEGWIETLNSRATVTYPGECENFPRLLQSGHNWLITALKMTPQGLISADAGSSSKPPKLLIRDADKIVTELSLPENEAVIGIAKKGDEIAVGSYEGSESANTSPSSLMVHNLKNRTIRKCRVHAVPIVECYEREGQLVTCASNGEVAVWNPWITDSTTDRKTSEKGDEKSSANSTS